MLSEANNRLVGIAAAALLPAVVEQPHGKFEHCFGKLYGVSAGHLNHTFGTEETLAVT